MTFVIFKYRRIDDFVLPSECSSIEEALSHKLDFILLPKKMPSWFRWKGRLTLDPDSRSVARRMAESVVIDLDEKALAADVKNATSNKDNNTFDFDDSTRRRKALFFAALRLMLG
jgi:hypothetical protein